VFFLSCLCCFECSKMEQNILVNIPVTEYGN
jgi:hypothetical protein